jgi:hypothetical protein
VEYKERRRCYNKMNPYFETQLGKLYCGDCLEILKELPDKSSAEADQMKIRFNE